MRLGASTPEDLESLLEDAFLIGTADTFLGLFDSGAVFSASASSEARGGEQIAQLASAIRDRGYAYIADSGRVLQARDTCLVLSEQAINVMQRGGDRRWRYAISVLDIDPELKGASHGARHH